MADLYKLELPSMCSVFTYYSLYYIHICYIFRFVVILKLAICPFTFFSNCLKNIILLFWIVRASTNVSYPIIGCIGRSLCTVTRISRSSSSSANVELLFFFPHFSFVFLASKINYILLILIITTFI